MRGILNVNVIHQGWNMFGIAKLATANGQVVERAIEHHGDAACVFPYDPKRRVALLVQQQRIGPLFCGDTEDLVEAPAGSLDGSDPAETAIREAMEECGVRLSKLEPIGQCYPMCSVSSERLWLYLASYSREDIVGAGGGLQHEGEHIKVLELPLEHLATQVRLLRLKDLKTFMLIQALQIRRPELFK